MSIYTSIRAVPYIYKLTHKTTGQFYYGYEEKNKVPSSESFGKLYFTSSKYVDELGFENFNYQIIAEFINPDHKSAALDAWETEQRMIEAEFKDPLILNKSYYKDGAQKFCHDVPHTPAAKEKIRMAAVGREASDKTKAILSKASKGKPKSASHCANIGNGKRGKKLPPLTEEHKKAISLGGTGQKRTQTTKDNISNALKGRTRSEEHRKNLQKALLGKKEKFVTTQRKLDNKNARRLSHPEEFINVLSFSGVKIEFQDGRQSIIVQTLMSWCKENNLEYAPIRKRMKAYPEIFLNGVKFTRNRYFYALLF